MYICIVHLSATKNLNTVHIICILVPVFLKI
uniref:Uncharacterized protein n=1 Tax=Arundo donax TaxID=35708 RepID=A0A0A9H7N4_ARUDO